MPFMKGVSPKSTASKNALRESVGHIDERAGSPVDEQLRISYGRISEVDPGTSQVRVQVFGRTPDEDRMLGATQAAPAGTFVPILQPLHVIHRLFGALRKNLCVRIFWRGKNQPGAESVVEVVSDDDCDYFRTGKKEPEQNVITTGPFKIFSGGLGL